VARRLAQPGSCLSCGQSAPLERASASAAASRRVCLYSLAVMSWLAARRLLVRVMKLQGAVLYRVEFSQPMGGCTLCRVQPGRSSAMERIAMDSLVMLGSYVVCS